MHWLKTVSVVKVLMKLLNLFKPQFSYLKIGIPLCYLLHSLRQVLSEIMYVKSFAQGLSLSGKK
jgi:hypothetical protein